MSMATYYAATTSPSSNLYWMNTSTSTAATPTYFTRHVVYHPHGSPPPSPTPNQFIDFLRTFHGELVLPDGAKLVMDGQGNYRIDDRDAKVVYRANRSRDFNRFINASDLIERFIEECRSLGLKSREFMNLPMGMFIHWLIIEAAKADGEDLPPGVPRLESGVKELTAQPRCRYCGQWIAARPGITFCSGDHMDRWLEENADGE